MLVANSAISYEEVEKLFQSFTATQDNSLWWFLSITILVNGIAFFLNVMVQFRLKNKEKDILRYEKLQDRIIQVGSDMFDTMTEVYTGLQNFHAVEDGANYINQVMTKYRSCKLFLSVSLCKIVEQFYDNSILAIAGSDTDRRIKAKREITYNLDQFKNEFHKQDQVFIVKK